MSMHTIYQSEIAHFNSAKTRALQAMVRKSLIGGDMDDMALTLEALNDYKANDMGLSVLALHLATEDLVAARDLVDDHLAAQDPDRDQWVVQDLLLSLREQDQSPLELDGNGVSELEAIADGEGLGAAEAQAWLALLGMPRAEEVVLPSTPRQHTPEEPPVHFARQPMIAAYPNPAKGPVYFTYRVDEGVASAELRLHDATGKLVLIERLAPKNGIAEFGADRLPGGLLIATLHWDGIQVAETKATVVR